jgi:dienelactone hydrolase
MEKLKLIVFYSLMLVALSLSKASAQQVFKTTTSSVIGYYEYLPTNYNSNSDKYPVVIFLHGIGERGPNTKDINTLKSSITSVAKNAIPKLVKNGTQFPFILISPQLKNNHGTWPSSYVMEVINHVKTYLRIDEKRIYLTGLSLGGGGVWVAAQDNATVFAAIAPVCGGYNTVSKAINLAKENLPVWAFHGDKDNVVNMSKTINMVNAINKCTPKPSPLAKVTIYPGVSHNSWDKAYRNDHSLHNPNVYEWMMSFTNTVTAGNKIPTAKAGTDQTKSLKTGNTTSIKGSGTDIDGSIASYAWAKMSGPSATLSATTTATLKVSALKKGTYIFQLKVKDNKGNTDSDYVKVTVKD